MIPNIENLYFYSRKDSVLIACLEDGTQVPLIKFKQKFPDFVVLEGQKLQYMKDYMEMWPDNWEIVYETKTDQQLSLF